MLGQRSRTNCTERLEMEPSHRKCMFERFQNFLYDQAKCLKSSLAVETRSLQKHDCPKSSLC